jgi:tetratricopeptide (TPR) repeat protein
LPARLLGSLVIIAGLAMAAWWAARSGVVSLFTVYAAKTNQLTAGTAAVNLNPHDADAHFVRGAILETMDQAPAAAAEYQEAIRARPGDYLLWLALARAQESSGDIGRAISAATEAARLAPFYAKPHWVLGNILVRAGKNYEGFRELRLAATSDKELLPALIDLEWQLSGGDVEQVKAAVQPDSPESYKALAVYFKNQGKADDATQMFRAAGPVASDERRQYLQELIDARKFKEAATLWSADHPPLSPGQLINAGFEDQSNLDAPGFGWRRGNKANSVILSLDANNPSAGRFSLRIDFNGDSDPGLPVISQLILVEPRAHYRLRFVARARDIVSGGLLYIAVHDANNNGVLGQSAAFPANKFDWQEYAIDFQTAETTSTLEVLLRRQPCGTSACPIFGHLWLDNFSLQKL